MRRLILVLMLNLCYLAVIMIFLVVTWWLLLVGANARYLVVNARYLWLPLVTARSHFQYERNKAHNFVQRIVRARGMYVAQIKPVQVVWGKLLSNFQVVRQVVRQTNRRQTTLEMDVGRQTSCIDLSIRHQTRHTKCDIKDFTKMVDEFKTKNVA